MIPPTFHGPRSSGALASIERIATAGDAAALAIGKIGGAAIDADRREGQAPRPDLLRSARSGLIPRALIAGETLERHRRPGDPDLGHFEMAREQRRQRQLDGEHRGDDQIGMDGAGGIGDADIT